MTKNQAIEMLLSNGIQAVVVYNQYDYNGRSFCHVRGYKDPDKAQEWADAIRKDSYSDYSWPRELSPEQAIKERNNIGADVSTNIEDNWDFIPVGLEAMEIC